MDLRLTWLRWNQILLLLLQNQKPRLGRTSTDQAQHNFPRTQSTAGKPFLPNVPTIPFLMCPKTEIPQPC